MVTDELTRIPAPVQEPAYASWRERPYGHLSAQYLMARQAEERAAAQRAEQLADSCEHRAAEQLGRLDAAPTPGGAFAVAAYEVLADASARADLAREEAGRALAARRHAESVRRIRERIEASGQKGRLALRLVGTSRRETLAITAHYQQQYEAAVAEAARASGASAEALHEAGRTLAAHPHASLLAPDGSWVPPGDARELAADLEAMRQRVPVLAARADAGIAEDARQLRTEAAAQRGTAVRHHERATAMRREAALREEMRAAAPRTACPRGRGTSRSLERRAEDGSARTRGCRSCCGHCSGFAAAPSAHAGRRRRPRLPPPWQLTAGTLRRSPASCVRGRSGGYGGGEAGHVVPARRHDRGVRRGRRDPVRALHGLHAAGTLWTETGVVAA